MLRHKPGNFDYALDTPDSMADSESDLETDGLELALETLCSRYCSDESSPKSKCYCSEFCELVEEYTGQWQVPLPQLKVLRTALCSFTKATAVFPDDCQHIHYVLSSLALSFFELMLFFSKEEFVEEPLKGIIDSFQECNTRLHRHRNIYLQHVKQIIKTGGPWENPVLQGILKEADLSPKEVEDYLCSELPIFFELRVRYLQACERLQEAKALSKSCLENHESGKHLYFHQAYLTCLYKASLHEHLHKKMAEIDGRDAVEIICNTERVEKDELLLSLCKAFLTQQLHNGDMYYIWDLVFIWSRLHLRAHPSSQGFLAECLQLASSATNVRAIFPFIKLVTTELGGEGVQVCVELCARALQLCDMQADSVTRSLVCKTIAFLLPHDLEICRACALLVFCQERSLEAYRTVCLLYMHPDQEPHPHNNPVRTSVRFHILQMLKERLCFDPEFWNLLAIRTQCLELMSDKVTKAAVLSEMKEEEETEYSEELSSNNVNDTSIQVFNPCPCTEAEIMCQDVQEEPTKDEEMVKSVAPSHKTVLKRRKWRRVLRRKKPPMSDDEAELGDDPEFKYNLKSTSGHKTMYSLRRNHTNKENSAAGKLPLDRKREYLSRCVKSQILKRKGHKNRWLQGLPRLEQVQPVVIKGKKRGRKPLHKLEVSYPENEISITEEESGFEKITVTDDELEMPHLENELKIKSELEENQYKQMAEPMVENGFEKHPDLICISSLNEQTQEKCPTQFASQLVESPPSEPQAAVEAAPELDGPPLELVDCPIEQLHSYSLKSKLPDSDKPQPPESPASEELNGDTEQKPQPKEETEVSDTKVIAKRTWRERMLRTQQYAHLKFHCKLCCKDYKGLNVMRHALSHLKSRKCILCGKQFKQLSFAKKHVLDHIEEMCKEKPLFREACSEETPAENGIEDVQNPSQPQVSKKAKPKVSSLNRELRIIRNLRTLVKKTSGLQKKSKNPNTNVFQRIDFKNDQVIINDGLVIVKGPSVMEKEGEGEGEGQPAGENGYGVEIKYHLCPSKSCDRVFLRVSSTLMRHAIKCHIKEEEVLEKTFVWAKHKCTLCLRKMQFFQHYKDHMKQHDNPLQYFCYHQDCNQRFLTQQELKDHVSTHKPIRPRCPFTACEKLFQSLQCLYDHEWRHYIPAPQRDELGIGPSRQKESSEAPWKQRVKVEEIWLQSKTEQRENPTPAREASNVEDCKEVIKTESHCEENDKPTVPGSSQEVEKSGNCSEKEPQDDNKAAINGYVDETGSQVTGQKVSASHSGAPGETPSRSWRKRTHVEVDPLNVKDHEDTSITTEGMHQKLGEPHITEHRTFKPEDPSYGIVVKAPFIRPPPSTYLDESVLSMRRRRSEEEPAPKKILYWRPKKNKDPDQETQPQVETAVPEHKIRHRCDKCLSSFSSLEELEKHRALNTCSALFGFDSDDES